MCKVNNTIANSILLIFIMACNIFSAVRNTFKIVDKPSNVIKRTFIYALEELHEVDASYTIHQY